MPLSPQKINLFNTFGFLKFPGLFADDIERISEEFETVWAGKEHDYTKRSFLVEFVEKNDYLSALMDDPRIEETIGSLAGNDFNYTSSDGNLYAGDTGWHSDGFTRHPGYTSIKIAFYLDSVKADTGCLRVIPGSHLPGNVFGEAIDQVLIANNETGYASLEKNWGVEGDSVPAVALESEPGDMVLFNHRIKHSSFGGSGRRRMFTLNFEERYRQEDLGLLSDEFEIYTLFDHHGRPYVDRLVETSNAKRLVHLEQRISNVHYLNKILHDAKLLES